MDETAVSKWAVNQPRTATQSSCGAAVYNQRGVSVNHQPLKSKFKALLDDTAVSAWTVYQPILASKSLSFAAVYPQRGRKSPSVAAVHNQRGDALYQHP